MILKTFNIILLKIYLQNWWRTVFHGGIGAIFEGSNDLSITCNIDGEPEPEG